jgi:hypothetical protein
MNGAFVCRVGTSRLLGTGATQNHGADFATGIPNLPRSWLNEAARRGRQRLQGQCDVRPLGAGVRDGRTEQITAAADCASVEAGNLADQVR